jgi:pimeloyl-ACP methyl ester carboxylesterase
MDGASRRRSWAASRRVPRLVMRRLKGGPLSSRSDFVASFIPGNPDRVLVLAHGYPWSDDSRLDSDLIEYARAAVRRWAPFAETHRAIVVAPVFGGQEFPRYREMLGRTMRPDEFVNLLVEQAAREHIPHFAGRFSLHGHSAGAQFAARYLVTHPERLDEVVLSAPSTFPMPDPGIPWPHGMATARIHDDIGSRSSGAASGHASAEFAPAPIGWLTAASTVSVTVLVGSRDTEQRPPAPGQEGSTRIGRATEWAESMRRHAQASKRTATIRFVMAEGFDHDEEAMAVPAQKILARRWRAATESPD